MKPRYVECVELHATGGEKPRRRGSRARAAHPSTARARTRVRVVSPVATVSVGTRSRHTTHHVGSFFSRRIAETDKQAAKHVIFRPSSIAVRARYPNKPKVVARDTDITQRAATTTRHLAKLYRPVWEYLANHKPKAVLIKKWYGIPVRLTEIKASRSAFLVAKSAKSAKYGICLTVVASRKERYFAGIPGKTRVYPGNTRTFAWFRPRDHTDSRYN